MDLTLRYLLIIRLIVIGGQLVALLAMDKAFGVAVPWLPVTAVLSVLAAFTVFSWGHASARGAGSSHQQYLVQSVTDVLAYFTGGSLSRRRQRRSTVCSGNISRKPWRSVTATSRSRQNASGSTAERCNASCRSGHPV